MWWHSLHNHDRFCDIPRKYDTLRKSNSVNVSGTSIDTSGMEKLFGDAVAPATAVTAKKRSWYVPISHAARMLGISERTVWRKIDKGELKSRLKNNKRMVGIPVFEPGMAVTEDCQTSLTDTPPNANAVVDLNVLLRELQGANYRIGFLESENQTYKEQVKLLPDYHASAAKAAIHEARVAELETKLGKIKDTWWYRFWSWFTGTAV